MTFNPEAATEYFPITYHQPGNHGALHRRGTSLDQPMRLQDSTTTTPGNGKVSTNQRHQQQQTMREAQMHGPSRPGQLSMMDDIFEVSPKIHSPEKDFGDFGPLGIDEGFAHAIGGLPTSTLTPCFLSQHTQSRPHTPHNKQIGNDYPLSLKSDFPKAQASFVQSSPIHHGSVDFGAHMHSYGMKRGNSFQESIQVKTSQSQGDGLASAPSTVPLRSSATFDVAPIPSSDILDIAGLQMDFSNCHGGYESSNYSPTQTSPAMSSLRSSPDLPPVTLFGEVTGGVPHFPPSELPSAPSSPTKARSSSPRKRGQALAEDLLVEDTGVTSEQVEAFIQGPDPETNKYMCLFENCRMGPFGRKENIRAHVQTHLGDRKYVCNVCQNKFVRPNDLKRHAIIHQEVKEFICKCGAAFGRQDALRRHRIRKPYCVDGDPSLELMRREEKKRGRPRKIAPTETNERRERKEHIRKQVMAKKRNGSSAPSVASSQKSARSCSPEQNMSPDALSFSPGNMSLTPPASPQNKEATIFTSQLVAPDHHSPGKSPSPPPTRGSLTAAFAHDGMDFGRDSLFATDPFGPCDTATFSPSESHVKSPSSSPPGLDLSSSPPAAKLLDFDDPLELDFSAHSAHSFDQFTSASSTTSFEDDFFSTNKLVEDILKDAHAPPTVEPGDTIADDVERYLFLDNI